MTKEERSKLKKLGMKTNSNAYKRFYEAGWLKEIDEGFAKEVVSYWKEIYGEKIDPTLHLAYMNLTGKKEKKLVPGKQMWNEIIPYLNDMNIRIGYSDKNIYDTLIAPTYSAEIILKRIRGHYYTSDNELIDYKMANKLVKNYGDDFIIKLSDSDNGKGISKVKNVNGELIYEGKVVELSHLEEVYKYNFVVQKVIKQHEIMAAPHPNSVNTLRMVTLRWNGEIHYLMAYARFGANNDVKDHSVHGGISVGLNHNGEFQKFGLDVNTNIHTHHPTTNYDLSKLGKIPNFEFVKSYVRDLHKKVLHHDYVSWDIAIGENQEPIFIESNYRGSVWRYQITAQQPVFGDLTEEIMEHIRKERANNVDRSIRSQSKIPGKLKRQIQKLEEEKIQLINKNQELKNQIERITINGEDKENSEDNKGKNKRSPKRGLKRKR